MPRRKAAPESPPARGAAAPATQPNASEPAPAQPRKPGRTSKAARETEALAALGAEKLAGVLLALAAREPAVRRRVELELAEASGPSDLYAALLTQLSALTQVNEDLTKTLQRRLGRDLTTLVERGATLPADLRLALHWKAIDVALWFAVNTEADLVFRDVVETLCDDLPEHVAAAGATDEAVADALEPLLPDLDDTIHVAPLFCDLLGRVGRERLRARLEARRLATTGDDQYHDRLRNLIADLYEADGDVENFLSQFSAEERTELSVVLATARMQLGNGDARGALRTLDAARERAAAMPPAVAPRPKRREGSRHVIVAAALPHMAPPPPERFREFRKLYIAALDATGDPARAQAQRWAWFETQADIDLLKEYLRRLPDFEDSIWEDRALAHLRALPALDQALQALVAWGRPSEAASLVIARRSELPGLTSKLLDLERVAGQLTERSPQAALVLLRAAFEAAVASPFTLPPPASVLTSLKQVAAAGGVPPEPTHDAWLADLKQRFPNQLRT